MFSKNWGCLAPKDITITDNEVLVRKLVMAMQSSGRNVDSELDLPAPSYYIWLKVLHFTFESFVSLIGTTIQLNIGRICEMQISRPSHI